MPRFIPPPGPGRPKGSKTKQQLAVEAKLEELGCDPITAMAHLAMHTETPLDQRVRLYCALAEYVAPRRKPIDGPVILDLPPLKVPQDAVFIAARILAATASGTITPTEASAIGKVLDLNLRAIDMHDHEARLAALEGRHE
jgi:hypothetical protein